MSVRDRDSLYVVVLVRESFGSGIFCVASDIRMQFVVLIELVVLIEFVTCLVSAIMIYLTCVCCCVRSIDRVRGIEMIKFVIFT